MMSLLPLTVQWLAGVTLSLFDGRRNAVAAAGTAVLGVVFVLDLWLLTEYTWGGREAFSVVTGGWPTELGIRLRVDGLSAFFAAVCGGVLFLVSLHETLTGVHARLFPALLMLLGAGLHGVFLAADVFNFYVFFELAIVASFALAAYGYERAELRGALIYVAVNLFGTVLLLVGVASLYHAAGTLDMAALRERLVAADAAGTLPAALLFAALCLKLGLFPFHGWVPVLYSHARPAVAAALAGALVNVGAYGLLRLGFTLFPEALDAAAPVLMGLGAAAAVYGAVLGMFRVRPAELAAYAAIVHAGYLVLALGIGGVAGIMAMLLLVLSGSLDKTLMFVSLEARAGVRRGAVLTAGFSFAGLPVTIGFLSKVMLLRAAVASPAPVVLSVTVVISAVLALGMAVRLHRQADELAEPARVSSVVVAGLAVITVALGLFPETCSELVRKLSGELIAEVS